MFRCNLPGRPRKLLAATDVVNLRHPMAEKQEPLTEQEQRVVQALHQARATVRAPDALKARIEAQRPTKRTRTRQRASYGTALAGALAVAALTLALVLPAGSPGGPSVSQAASLASLGPAGAAPAPDPRQPLKLQTSVQEVYFPNWSEHFGWSASGRRSDRLQGRSTVTVYYDWRGKRIAYTIVAAPALAQPGASVTTLNGTALRTLTLNGRTVVTWRRANHTCVLSGTGVSASELQKLAAWRVPQAAD